MTKSQFKQTQHANRLAARKAINQGLAISIKQAAMFGLLATIHAEIAPQKEAIEKRHLLLEKIASRRAMGNQEKQGYVADLQKYRDKFAIGHRVASGTDTDLASENEPRFAMIQESAKIAETGNE